MYEFIDQFFVKIGRRILEQTQGWDPWAAAAVSLILTIVPILLVFPTIFALTTWAERKLLGRIQNRMGPNRVGPVGLFQPVADGIKTLTKEDIVPARADHFVHTLAPILTVIAAFLALTVLPMGRNMIPADLHIGVLFFFAVGSISEVAIFLAGWSSRNKYSLLGGMRAIAQMVSYEIPFVLSALTAVMIVGSLSTVKIVEAQTLGWVVEDPVVFTGFGERLWWFLERVWYHFGNHVLGWHVFQPWGFFGFMIFFIAALAELNRSPFDIPEAESEIVAGHHTEYSGFKFALFFMAEYISMMAICGLGVTLFLGGWNGPKILPSWGWFFLKIFVLMFVMIWVRGTFPRVRVDQLMGFAWKLLLPMSLLNIFAAGAWHHIPSRPLAWALTAVFLGSAYQILSVFVAGRNIQKRMYRYA
ncbi:MAG: NADH-quinone oxidoreductase subunit H [Verrucomicrobia bacterium]|nr:NADH-quinone oxidoreductase subunit H [Verrucomicrobiota bacterium]